MPNARFKDLILDANEPAPLGRFWAAMLAAEWTPLGEESNADGRIEARPGAPESTQIWVNRVPEPRTAKTRAHLDLRLPAADPGPLVALGAQIVTEPGADPWWLMADPDGNQFCAFPPGRTPAEPGRPGTPFELVVDCGDSLAQANWWAEQTGGEVRKGGDDWGWVEGAEGYPFEAWCFNPVPEPKTVKNRVHWDVDLTAPDPSALIEAGATLLREPDDDIRWWILADPEGNEFCCFPPE
jgi:hypothetical protein